MTRRVLIIDDSPVFCRILSGALQTIDDVEVVGVAHTAEKALRVLPRRKPDLVTLDILMPDQSGIETLKQLRREHPALKVLMVSSLTRRGGVETVQCLQLGASDYLLKPGAKEGGLRALAEGLERKLTALLPTESTSPGPLITTERPKPPPASVEVIAIASSTGGPAALTDVLPRLPASLPIPVVVVQHILPEFTQHLVASLAKRCAMKVELAQPGVQLRAGRIYLAPSLLHTVVVEGDEGPRFASRSSPRVHGCRPAADVLFPSLPAVYGERVVAVVLTGIGEDGCMGSGTIRDAGGWILAQNLHESVATPMPAAVMRQGYADETITLDALAGRLVELARGGAP